MVLWGGGTYIGFCLFIVFVELVFNNPTQKLLDPFPAYPNSTPYALSPVSTFPSQGCEISGQLQTEEVFITTNNAEQIRDFYSEIGRKNGWKQSKGYDFQTGTLGINRLCFEGKGGNRWYPINAIVLLDHLDSKDAQIIASNFPNAPPNTNLILSSQGYWLGD